MNIIDFFVTAKKAEDGINAIKSTGVSLYKAYKAYNEYDKKIRTTFSTVERKYFNDRPKENLLYYYLCYPKYRVIVLTGAISGGKTMMINNVSKKVKCETFDYNDAKDRIILKNSKSTHIVYEDEKNENFDDYFIIVDNIQNLDDEIMDIVADYASESNRIILACRECSISTNDSIVLFDFNKYNYTCKRKSKKNIDSRIWRKLPPFMKKPIFFEVLSNKIVSNKIKDDRLFAEKIENLCSLADENNPKQVMFDFFDEIFTLLDKKEINLLILYAIVMRNNVYRDSIIKILFRKVNIKTFKNQIKKGNNNENLYIVYNEAITSFEQMFHNKYQFLVGSYKGDLYLHEIISDYLLYRFDGMNDLDKSEILNSDYFISIVANTNWRIKNTFSEPFDRKIEYISYAYNLIRFFYCYCDDIYKNYKYIQHFKNYMHLINSYAYIILKISSIEAELEELRLIHNKIVSFIDDSEIERKWGNEIQHTNLYRAKTEFYHISAKIHLSLALAKQFPDISMFNKAVYFMDKYKQALSQIHNSIRLLEREENYHFAMAMIYYKSAISLDLLKVIEIDQKKYTSSKSLLSKAKNEILIARSKDLNLLKIKHNINLDLNDYKTNELLIIDERLFGDNLITALLLTLRLQCVIESLLVRYNPSEKDELDKLLDFTMYGFKMIAKARSDTMRYRLSILIKMLRADGSELKSLLQNLNISSNQLLQEGIEETKYNKFLLLKSLVLCIKKMDYDEELMKKMCIIYNIDIENTFSELEELEVQEKITKLENSFYILVTA